MLDPHFIRENPERVRTAIRQKNSGSVELVDRVLELDESYRACLTELQQNQSDANTVSASIGELMRAGKQEAAGEAKSRAAELKVNIKEKHAEAKTISGELNALLLEIPNIPHDSVPEGKGADDNQVVFETNDKPAFEFEPVPHWDLLDKHNLVDFDRGSKVTGAGFPFYLGQGARLQRALVAFFLDLAVKEGGYQEIQPPYVVNSGSATGTGQLPDKEDQMYELARDDLFLIPTAEVPITNFFRDEIIDEDDLPVKFCAYTPCFRREAGSYGKDVRGLNRIHQFDKVELVQFVHPDLSYEALEGLRADAERALDRLKLPYRRLLMCTGEMGFTQAKKYDLEVWSAGQKKWLEVSSISNYEAYQARRMKIRYRPKGAVKPTILHTLNGSGLALPRIVAALLENNQQDDRTIRIPEVLVPYTGFDVIG
ncbi:MAG: serine--tRNA ligase [Bacteroidetes bacterium]|nr:serine--tRNA ligase [Bacteroidota bacterium]MCH8244810.1 serine--tRNA ligase [Bacteroidota bacterium]